MSVQFVQYIITAFMIVFFIFVVPILAASRIIRRMKTHAAPLPPPPVKRLEPILPPMTDASLMNKQRLLNIVYNQLQGIVSHARFVNNTILYPALYLIKKLTCFRLGAVYSVTSVAYLILRVK